MTSHRDKQRLNEKHSKILARLTAEEPNKYCADCGVKGPRWASWNIGAYVCLRCAGIHRSLGVHISRMKSVTLDSWTPEQIESIKNGGNAKVNAIYEARLPKDFSRPTHSDQAMEHFIRQKYEKKVWYDPSGWERVQPAVASNGSQQSQLQQNRGGIAPPPTASPNRLSPSVSPQRQQQQPVSRPTPPQPQQSGANDLLGLDMGGGASQPLVQEVSAGATTYASIWDSDPFADQPGQQQQQPVERGPSPSVGFDKNSIMALYGNAPAGGMDGGMMGGMPQQPQQGMMGAQQGMNPMMGGGMNPMMGGGMNPMMMQGQQSMGGMQGQMMGGGNMMGAQMNMMGSQGMMGGMPHGGMGGGSYGQQQGMMGGMPQGGMSGGSYGQQQQFGGFQQPAQQNMGGFQQQGGNTFNQNLWQ
eukprot:Clim_evm14s169 gene=Clim_evmTU14s169